MACCQKRSECCSGGCRCLQVGLRCKRQNAGGRETEHDNLRAALAWSLGGGQAGAETGLRLAGALGHFWFVRGYWSEGREWLERTLAKAGSGGSTRAKALYRAGFIAYIP